MVVLVIVSFFVGAKSRVEMNVLGNSSVVYDDSLVVSVIEGIIWNPEFGHLNLRVTQFSMRNPCITQQCPALWKSQSTL